MVCFFVVFFKSMIDSLNEGQGHPNSYQNVEYSRLYHIIKFEEIGL